MLVPAGVAVNFTAVFNNPTPAYVAFSIYNGSTLVSGPTLMTQVLGNTYTGKYTFPAGIPLTVFMGVYTNGGFSALDPSFATSQQLTPVIAEYLNPPVQNVVGFVNSEGCETPGTFNIFLGDSKTMYLQGVESDCFGVEPLDLTDCTDIGVNLPNADGTTTTLLYSMEQVAITQPPNLGYFSVPISSEVSALLRVGTLQNIVVTFTILGQVFSVSFTGALSVFQVN